MKKPYLLLLFCALCACGDPTYMPPESYAKNRPEAELGLIKVFNKEDDAYNNQTNEIGQKQVLDSSVVKVTNYINSDLQFKIENWAAVVYKVDIQEDPLGRIIELSVVIPRKENVLENNPRVDAITFKASIKYDDVRLRNTLKGLKPFDVVSINGIFKKMRSGNIDFTGGELMGEFVLASPKLEIELTDIKKLN